MSKPVTHQFVLLDEPDANTAGEVAILSGRNSCHYYFCRLESEMGGIGMRFRKVDRMDGSDPEESTYDILLDGDMPTCSCKGWNRHGYCKHIKAALWVIAECLKNGYPMPLWREWPDQLAKIRTLH